MTVFPGRFLVILAFSILLSRPAQAGWPKILVLPPVAATEMDQKIKDEFQWDLVDMLKKCRYFESVTQRGYEKYLKEHNVPQANAIPDSLLPRMMESLEADLYARPTLSQPGGKGTEFSARVTYVYPKDHYTKDDYIIESEWHSEESEQRSWYLAGEYIDVIVDSRVLISAMIKARSSYNESTNGKAWSEHDLRAIMDGAQINYRKLVGMEPDNRTFNYMVGICLFKARRYDKAIAQFSHILANIDPEHVPTHETLANYYYFTSNDYEGALRHFSKLAEIDPKRYTYTHYWALSLDRLERKEEAVEIYEKLIGIEDRDADVRHLLADYYYNKASEPEAAGNSAAADLWTRKAADYMVRSCEISRSSGDPDEPAWITLHCQRLNFLAMLQHELNDTGKEIETLRKIVELDPSFPGASYNLGVYAHKAGDFEEAIDYYEKAVDCAEDAQKAELNFQIGVINLQQFRGYPQAITALTAALETNDVYMKEMAYYFRATAYLAYARELDCAPGEVADIKAPIGSGTISHARADRVLELYAKSLADLRKVATGNNPKVVRSARRHVDRIAKLQERLGKIKRRIGYDGKNR